MKGRTWFRHTFKTRRRERRIEFGAGGEPIPEGGPAVTPRHGVNRAQLARRRAAAKAARQANVRRRRHAR